MIEGESLVQSRVSGSSPIIVTVPHDGGLRLPGFAERDETTRWHGESRDTNVLPLAHALQGVLLSRGMGSLLIWCNAHRSLVDVNREPDNQPYVDPRMEPIYNDFFVQLGLAINQSLYKHHTAIVLDLHGYIRSPGPEQYDVVLGSDSHRTTRRQLDFHLQRQFHKVGLACEQSPDRARNVSARYRGGWIVRTTAARWLGLVEACQIELAPRVRADPPNEYGQRVVTGIVAALSEVLTGVA